MEAIGLWLVVSRGPNVDPDEEEGDEDERDAQSGGRRAVSRLPAGRLAAGLEEGKHPRDPAEDELNPGDVLQHCFEDNRNFRSSARLSGKSLAVSVAVRSPVAAWEVAPIWQRLLWYRHMAVTPHLRIAESFAAAPRPVGHGRLPLPAGGQAGRDVRAPCAREAGL